MMKPVTEPFATVAVAVATAPVLDAAMVTVGLVK
jgi:hypothetical protein